MTPLFERSALDLARAIRRRELSATEVVQTHIERHQRLGARINALVAERFEDARLEAAAADERVAEACARAAADERVAPARARTEVAALDADLPLLGVPFTVKESIALQGMPHSARLVARRDLRAEESAPAVQRLIDSGAIPLGVTNTWELTLWIESANNLYGRTSSRPVATRRRGDCSRRPVRPRRACVGCCGAAALTRSRHESRSQPNCSRNQRVRRDRGYWTLGGRSPRS